MLLKRKNNNKKFKNKKWLFIKYTVVKIDTKHHKDIQMFVMYM